MAEIKNLITGHVRGATYYSKYWGEQYTVLNALAAPAWGKDPFVTVRWANGSESTHCTRVNDDERVG